LRERARVTHSTLARSRDTFSGPRKMYLQGKAGISLILKRCFSDLFDLFPSVQLHFTKTSGRIASNAPVEDGARWLSFPDKTLHLPLLDHRYTMVRCVAAALLGTLAVASAYTPTLPIAALRSEYPTICHLYNSQAMVPGHAGCADKGRVLKARSAARAVDAVCCSFLIGLLCCFGVHCASVQKPSIPH
jgi:hypothetical protein